MAPSLQTAALSTLKFPAKCPMDWPIPKLADVLRARRLIPPYLPVTPAIEPARLTLVLRYRAVLKCENLNLTGASRCAVVLISWVRVTLLFEHGVSLRLRLATTVNRLPTLRGYSAAKPRS
jgi:hypothetical protein